MFTLSYISIWLLLFILILNDVKATILDELTTFQATTLNVVDVNGESFSPGHYPHNIVVRFTAFDK